MRILVTGGCGYVGSALVPELLNAGHKVIVVDVQWFGMNLMPHENLLVLKDDLRDGVDFTWLHETDCVIHLAAVANDPCGELNPKLAWETNALGTMQLIDAAARAGVPRFIYASSGSVYGVKSEAEVTEDLTCVPLSDYNKTKMVAEQVVQAYWGPMVVQILRPATVCGYSPRTRLDVAVNALTISALTTGRIRVFGGDQMRPNVHIADMVRAYQWLLDNPACDGVFNVGFENHSLFGLASLVKLECGGDIVVEPSVDARSYRLSSQRILDSGFRPAHTVQDAIRGLRDAYKAGLLRDDDNGYNLRRMPR